MDIAVAEEATKEETPFSMFDEAAQIVETSVKKIARSVAFRETVCRIYENTCAACGTALKSPAGSIELDAAHIVPRSRYGSDDARNGLALCKRHHWAFDGGLFGISDDFKIVVPAHVGSMSENRSLKDMGGQPARLPTARALTPNIEALRWHRQNIVLKSL